MLGRFERYSATGSDERQLYWHAVNCSKVKIFIDQIITGENLKKKLKDHCKENHTLVQTGEKKL